MYINTFLVRGGGGGGGGADYAHYNRWLNAINGQICKMDLDFWAVFVAVRTVMEKKFNVVKVSYF